MGQFFDYPADIKTFQKLDVIHDYMQLFLCIWVIPGNAISSKEWLFLQTSNYFFNF